MSGSRAIDTDLIERTTGTPWSEWVTRLDAIDARALSHRELAKRVPEMLPASIENPSWWAQTITVAYEQHIGRRQPGQTCDGDFSVSTTRTLPGDRRAAMAAWLRHVKGVTTYDAVPASEAKHTETEKWSRWRMTLADGTKVVVESYDKTPTKVPLSITHRGLDSPEAVERWRTFWKGQLAQL